MLRKLEVCCYGLESAIKAAQAGADRIELCSAPREGGLTPSYAALCLARETLSVPAFPIVRPRGGDFCYSDAEIAVMEQDLKFIRQAGFKGAVFGVLDEQGAVDVNRMERLLKQCDGMEITFHRAFDMCRSPFDALKTLEDLGVKRILTSGQQPTAERGIELLAKLHHASRGPVIMAGSGVRAANIAAFLAIGLNEVHSSAGLRIPSAMQYRNPNVCMSHENNDEYLIDTVSEEGVREMKDIMRNFILSQ
ncbi:copper homeostasis protein CutC [Brenneria izadpanahii]|uniref:PF03932 family protein CutC n=1 Tax=Brenneria izadpanahii TaxID=2722756 RepID=A0ABX7UUH7_9GAMM|nr:copper homeostasis protein CutC [Brenneria izadpanahii]QTF07850.1 copper homeostasis protein CutC [Brenneria izadpanahii]